MSPFAEIVARICAQPDPRELGIRTSAAQQLIEELLDDLLPLFGAAQDNVRDAFLLGGVLVEYARIEDVAQLYEILRNVHDGILLFDRILIDRKRDANPV